MQSSAPGRGVSGATNPSTSQRPPSDSRASSESFIQEGTGHIAPNLDGATAASTAWYYQPGTQPSAGDESVQPLASSSSSTMIGPTFTSYSAENTPFHEDEAANYQQWVNSYNQQAQLQSQQHQTAYGPSYRQDAPTLPRSEAQATNLSQNPYSFMQNQYTSSNSGNQYGGSGSATALPANLDSTSFQPQSAEVYPSFYTEILAMNTNNTSSPDQAQSYHGSTPESTLHSYSNSPDPLYQQQLQGQQPQQPIQHHAQHMPNPQAHFQQQPQMPQQQQGHQQQRRQQHVQPQQTGQRQQQPPNQQQHLQQYQTQNQPQKPHAPQPPQRFVQQQLNPPVVANRQTQKPAAKSSDFQQQPPQPVRFAAPRNLPEQAPQPPQPIATSAQGPVGAPPLAPQWTAEANFQPKKPAPTSTVIHQYVPPSSANFGTAKAGPSQPKLPVTNTPLKRATAPSAAEENFNTSPGNKTSAKRKRFKKNDAPQEGSYGGDSDSDSEDDFDGLGMSGRIEVGLGGLGVVGKGKKDKGSRL
ncbi:hypothetical protein D9619_008702 [Psilocybe cf. subviscida]|uniref:Uncharacterized protein n=1 Tax=Psilocybe cf. subviscida TaxID=2480587 RepID=A0A8H5B9N2_9AGAR|nr:hypothetical protein D9619_008702 [Psilocybe cf. subviscida]